MNDTRMSTSSSGDVDCTVDKVESAPAETIVRLLCRHILAEAHRLYEEDVAINSSIGSYGAALLPQGCDVIHHCNTGALATVDIGTALGVVYAAHNDKKDIHVWVDETRPRLQGARLTAYELQRAGVPFHLMADGAAGLLLRQTRLQAAQVSAQSTTAKGCDGDDNCARRRKVDAVLFGADRVAANGDVANKIGTYPLALCAHTNDVPTYACVPTSTIDLTMASGAEIPIEERSATEVTHVDGVSVAPQGVEVFNPAFDVTPAAHVTAIITECGVCYPPFESSLCAAKEAAEAKISASWEETLRSIRHEVSLLLGGRSNGLGNNESAGEEVLPEESTTAAKTTA